MRVNDFIIGFAAGRSMQHKPDGYWTQKDVPRKAVHTLIGEGNIKDLETKIMTHLSSLGFIVYKIESTWFDASSSWQTTINLSNGTLGIEDFFSSPDTPSRWYISASADEPIFFSIYTTPITSDPIPRLDSRIRFMFVMGDRLFTNKFFRGEGAPPSQYINTVDPAEMEAIPMWISTDETSKYPCIRIPNLYQINGIKTIPEPFFMLGENRYVYAGGRCAFQTKPKEDVTP